MKKLAQTLGLCLFMTLSATAQKNYVSEVWVADQGNGTYKNPILMQIIPIQMLVA